jgi:methylenetetrahydrofolate dehydrogenase (NADP+)/methenyltetrahydrofolate cyclohydrolase
MLINGKEIAEEIISQMQEQVDAAKARGITPRIAIITLGLEEAWKAYVGQKIKLAKRLGVAAELINLQDASQEELLSRLKDLNNDPSIHGIIAQRPFPPHIDNEIIVNAISREKDIDGFREDSLFEVPVWLAVKKLLEEIHNKEQSSPDFISWLQKKNIVIVGKGITAGQPIEKALIKLGIIPTVVRRDTPDPEHILKEADIIISAVGKTIIKPSDLKQGVILIGVGLHRNEEGKLKGDYEDVEEVASFYTPSPGGVGPVNLAYLFKNLLSNLPQ